MVSFDELTADILTESGGCPEMILERNLRNAAIHFLTESELWQARVTIPSVAEQSAYALATTADQSIVKLTYCSVNGAELLQAVPQRHFPEYGKPKYYFLRDNQIHILPEKYIEGDIIVELVYKPNRLATGIPDQIADEWFEVIQQGALARTLAMPGTPWYDVGRAQLYGQQYANGLYDARLVGTRQNHSRIMTTRFSW